MKIVAVIPARMGSSRFPGKPLAPILGRPMIEHVYRRVAMAPSIDQVYLATCDEEIRAATEAFGGNAIMTAATHTRCSERVAEAAANLDADIIVMVQGDEPMTTPDMIEASVRDMKLDPAIQCVNLTARIPTRGEWESRNTIKVVMDRQGNALYFSRRPIPTDDIEGFDNIPRYKQVCIIPFRRDALQQYVQLAPTPLELAESVDMMRFVENGIPVRMVEVEFDTHAVDTPADLAEVERRMANDPLLCRY